jgi:DNA topoisomerase-1
MNETVQYVEQDSLTIRRVTYGNGFRYLKKGDLAIRDKKILRRLKKLVIPPMWTDVNVCAFPDGHLQATGRDKKGRKQYIYHENWSRMRQEAKFAKLKKFAKKLPKARSTCIRHIKDNGWNKSKVLAIIVLILDDCGIRIGNQQYTDRNETYGLTTLRRKHLKVNEAGRIELDFIGKKSKERHVELYDKELISLIKKSADMPGYEIFRYQDSQGTFHNIDSDSVNEYIHSIVGKEFSAKDFRTWVGCRLAIEYYNEARLLKLEKPRRKFTNILLRLVSSELGNTPTVAKDYYIHPAILQAAEDGNISHMDLTHNKLYDAELSSAEQEALRIITLAYT